MHRLSSKKGFTLLELTAVVAIVGILAAIAIPQFSAYRERAQNTEALAILEAIASSQLHHKLRTGVFVSCPPNPPKPGDDWNSNIPEWNRISIRLSGKLYFQYEVLADEREFVAYARSERVMYKISSDNLELSKR